MINEFDLVFIIDTSGSMGSFIQSAKTQMLDVIKHLAGSKKINLRIGVVQYEDHPPESSMLTRVHPLTTPDKAQTVVNKLEPAGGGDWPEAVFDGIVDACKKIKWRKHSRRIAILIGDAPPHGKICHGNMHNDHFPDGCPCGETMESVGALCEQSCIILYSIGLTNEVKLSFEKMSRLTGGEYFSSHRSAIQSIEAILKDEFGHLDIDQKVLDSWTTDVETAVLADQINISESEVLNAIGRLGTRGLLAMQ